jgi:hypothetical protein
MSIYTEGLPQQEGPNNSTIPELQSLVDGIKSDSSTTIFPSLLYPVSNDDEFYLLPTSTKRKPESLGCGYQETLQKPKRKKPRRNEESQVKTAANDSAEEIQSDASLEHPGTKNDARNNPYSHIPPFFPGAVIPEEPVPTFNYISYAQYEPFFS